MATHSSISAWEIPPPEEPGRLHSWHCKELDMTEHTHIQTKHWEDIQVNKQMYL